MRMFSKPTRSSGGLFLLLICVLIVFFDTITNQMTVVNIMVVSVPEVDDTPTIQQKINNKNKRKKSKKASKKAKHRASDSLTTTASSSMFPNGSVLTNSTSNTTALSFFTESNRCALLFFGLPRSFEELVLPSIVENLLQPNAHHNCDVFVHYYYQKEEIAGRLNDGGSLGNPDAILQLKDYLLEVHDQHQKYNSNSTAGWTPRADFVNDTEPTFQMARGALLKKYHETTDPNTGKPKYFPWKEKTFDRSSLDNVIRQWHSIQQVFQLLEFHSLETKVRYSRIGMFRSDTMFVTPIDITKIGTNGFHLKLGNKNGKRSQDSEDDVNDNNNDDDDDDQKIIHNTDSDRSNQVAIIPGFAGFPVNDRMMYGPYSALKVWATQRFDLIEERATRAVSPEGKPGRVLHPEKFLFKTLFPVVTTNTSTRAIYVDNEICFLRTRPNSQVMISDCAGSTRGGSTVMKADDSLQVVESIIKRECRKYKFSNNPSAKWGADCSISSSTTV